MKNKISLITICAISIFVLFLSVKKKWTGYDGEYWRSIIQNDGYGYFAYLPFIFIYHSFDYDRYVNDIANVRQGVPSKEVWNRFPLTANNKRCDKYFTGVAVLILPFFIIAYFLSYLAGYPLNGVSYIFQVFVSIAAIFYLAIGLVYLRKLLRLYSLSEAAVAFILILIVFSTNLLCYVIFEPSMSHTYSFGITAVFLYNVKKYSDSYKIKYLLGIGISLSILLIIRPTNLLSILFIPFICGSYIHFSKFIRSLFKGWYILPVILLTAAIAFIQPLLWYLQTGCFFVDSYPGEIFYFSHPHYYDILFSYNNGWYLYTPVMFFSTLGGLIVLWIKNKFQFIWLLLFIGITTYLLSSWWCWWYGGFGLRAFIDFYPEFTIVLGIIFLNLKNRWTWGFVICISFLCTFLNLFQTDQYFNFILQNRGMNKDMYWKVFLKRDKYYVGIYNYPDTSFYNIIQGYTYVNDLKNGSDEKNVSKDIAYLGNPSVVIGKDNPLHQLYSNKVEKLPKAKFLNLFLSVFEYLPDFDSRIAFDIKIQSARGSCYFYKTLPLLGFASSKNNWSKAFGIISLPPFKDSTDVLNVSIENPVSKAYIEHAVIRFAIPQ